VSTDRSKDYFVGVVRKRCTLPRETEWVEFKDNNANPQEIGEYLSALANSAAYNGKASAYLIWGVENETHRVVGTRFSPFTSKKGNEPLETWLLHLLTPKIHFQFYELTLEEQPVVLLEIGPAFRQPVRFQNEAFIRIGSVKKPLKDVPDRERALWRAFDQTPFERGTALERVPADEVLRLLDYPAYFELLEQPLPSNRDRIIKALSDDGLIHSCEAGGWNITHLGAILFAKRLNDFHTLRRKAIRVIQYRGTGRTETVREQDGGKGYASGFAGLVAYINGLLPTNEVIGQALRKTVPMYPGLAVRELVANALIHQDFFVTGAGPMVEIFDDRIEITNPGEPLVDTRRFVDTPPKSRNETLASLMRRFRICEERGSGIDKVVFEVELFQLPAPLFETPDGFTRAVLFAYKELKDMDQSDRVRACYLHACLRHVMRKPITNASLRTRFGIEEKNSALASRLLNEAVEDGAIVVRDFSVGTKSRSYLPYWAAPSPNDPVEVA
jgi:predicted HTH transcriptional regulator